MITETHTETAAAAPTASLGQYQAVRAGILQPRVSVIIPALNEARNLPHVFAALPERLHEVILVGRRDGPGWPASGSPKH
jgi:cellulose synthase/poly-beta-1,6-N-acetylglucosamine synthase-like glycosyltransferase